MSTEPPPNPNKPPSTPIASLPTIPLLTKNNVPPLPQAAKLPIRDPNFRPYRPKKRIHTAPKRPCFSFCCCFQWLLIVLFILSAAAAGVLWMLYKPERPRFTIASLQLSNLNLTGNIDSDASGHLRTSGNLTISAKNPNSKISTFYDAFEMSTFSQRGVLIANSSFNSFASDPGYSTVLRFMFLNDQMLDLDAARVLRADLRGRNEIGVRVELDTRMGVQIGKWRTKKIGIRVLCVGVRVKVPKKETVNKGLAPASAPAVAVAAASDDGSCKVNLSINFWGFVF